eukprot:EC724547.1.p1 GENE.EC724547.1~~EC724547.1.p1  ORF type:complete len:196 (+),score=43.89 EC724547.1:61-648(+)
MRLPNILLVIIACVAFASALTIPVDANREECVFEDVDVGQKVTVSYQVTGGGSRDIDVNVYGPDDKAVYNAQKQSDGKFTFAGQQKGIYRVCFSNKMSSVSAKMVSFFTTVGEVTSGEFAKAGDLTPLENSIVTLSEGLASVQAEQRYMRMRERVHRDTTESTNSRVKWWGITQAIILLGMALFQIYYIRSFFEV